MPRGLDSAGSRRRTFLKGTVGAVGLTSLAGCFDNSGTSGDSGNGSVPGADGEMIMTTSTETTSAYSMSQVIANAVSQNSDLTVQARPSEGTNANIGRLQRDESDISYIQNWTASKVANGEDPFGNLDYTPYQVFHLYDLAWFLCTANDGWTSVSDIGSGDRISPTPSGSGTAEMLEYALGFVTEDYERISIDYGSQGGAMSEGRLDAGAGTFINGSVEPGWLQQMKGTVDLRLLQWPDDTVSELEQDPAIIVNSVDTTAFDNYGYAPDTLNTPGLSYNFVVRDDFSGETLKSFLNTLWEQREGLGESNALLGPMTEGEHWTKNSYTTLPFHPAAAEFYKDKGVWNDEYEIGE
ncbi:TAXI family TRAP transporter solute-binding subunit [Natrinema halophilum]|uniref:TAXI family TRAP transporter solute-binding subunit n=1 Tax=Natrinema halophilum TaxID=1699371 RepID=A0A7D5GUL4_9EURY|nr:TAXI family TRAP transporter solute-binding subunit [Natrinema halophilum]QLG50186.1 TAXI family TRAP transporter solute-binding subunit [Natrinema halophilum]